jgi:hypothetical protein
VRIDPKKNHVTHAFSGVGGGAMLFSDDALWITASGAAVWKVDPKRVKALR